MKLKQVLLMLLLSMFISTTAFASGEVIKITIDGVRLETDVAPQAINNRTMVPIRAIFEAIGGEVEWKNDTQTAIGRKGSDTIKLQVGNKKASINGKEVILDVPATAVNQRTLVPIRFVAESLGSSVTWDAKTNTVVIEKLVTGERNFKFNKEKGEITNYRYDGPKDVSIPKTIDGVAVKSIYSDAFSYRDLLSVTIPKGITNIGEDAFAYNNITSAIIPEGIKSISDRAFAYNKLPSVKIPEGVTSIGSEAFLLNKITSVTIPESVTNIGSEAFFRNSITSLTIQGGITSIGDSAFGVNQLTSLTIPGGVKNIGSDAFFKNDLTSLTISEGVKNIGSGAFNGNNLVSVEIPESVTSIGGFAFSGNDLTSVIIPKGVTDLDDDAFDDNVEIIRE